MSHSIHFNERVRGKLTDVCNYASGIRNERPKLLASNCGHELFEFGNMRNKIIVHGVYG